MKEKTIHNVREHIIDVFGCRQDLTDPIVVNKSIDILKEAAEMAGAKVIEIHCTTYTVHGFTTVALLAESHIILTTWPEFNYASINIYLCNSKMDDSIVFNHIIQYLKSESIRSTWFRHLALPNMKKKIFLAAPFSQYLVDGVFEKYAFDKIISMISVLRKHGYSVFSAHERENFGEQLMEPSTCTPLDFKEINQCDIVVALIEDSSFGVSLELGWASALRKPIILYQKLGAPFSSPLIEGICEITDTKLVSDINTLLLAIEKLK